jgi:hypothetical protein
MDTSLPIFEGVIVSNPPDVTAFSGEADGTNDEHWFELTKPQLQIVLPNCVGKPVRVEHGVCNVGEIQEAFLNKHNQASIKFSFHNSPVGLNAQSLVQSGLMRGMSLSHDSGSLDVREVSICFEGARPNTGVRSASALTAAKTNQDIRKTSVPVSLVTTKVRTQNWIIASSMSDQVQQDATTQPAATTNTGNTGHVPMSTPNSMTRAEAVAMARQILSEPEQTSPPNELIEPGGAVQELKTTDSDIIQQIVTHNGVLTDEMKNQLLDRITTDKTNNNNMAGELSALQSKLTDRDTDVAGLQQQFMDIVIPYLKLQLGTKLSPEVERNLMKAARNENAKPFLEVFTPTMVMASACASRIQTMVEETSKNAAAMQMHQKLRLYNEAMQHSSRSVNASKWDPPTQLHTTSGWSRSDPIEREMPSPKRRRSGHEEPRLNSKLEKMLASCKSDMVCGLDC